MSRDLAERVWDECEDEDEDAPNEGDGDGSKLETSAVPLQRPGPLGNDAPPRVAKRWPKTLVASVARANGSVSRRGAFPRRPANGPERAESEMPRVVEDAVAAAAKALVETATSRVDPAALLTKLSLVAMDVRTHGGGGGLDDPTAGVPTGAPRSLVSSFFPTLAAAAETTPVDPERAAARKPPGPKDVEKADEPRERREPRFDGSEPINTADAWRAFARGEMGGADFHALKRRRVEWLEARRRR